jgi:very-short-patch-repair endonuclease
MESVSKYHKRYDWSLIQKDHDNGMTWRQLQDKYGLTTASISNAKKRGVFISRNKSEARKLAPGRPLTEETKQKLSIARKKYLEKNPDKVPYKLNHSSKESYPEKYFSEVFEKENIKVERYYYIGLYELDFCIPEKKIDIEIDGDQHYDDKKVVESDKRRTIYLEDNGWDIIRIRWSDYNKLLYDEKLEFIKNLKKYIDNLINEKPTIDKKEKNGYNLCECGNNKWKTSKSCVDCSKKLQRKVERPTLEQLKLDIENLGYVATGKKYGVSDNSIRKWIKSYQKELEIK